MFKKINRRADGRANSEISGLILSGGFKIRFKLFLVAENGRSNRKCGILAAEPPPAGGKKQARHNTGRRSRTCSARERTASTISLPLLPG